MATVVRPYAPHKGADGVSPHITGVADRQPVKKQGGCYSPYWLWNGKSNGKKPFPKLHMIIVAKPLDEAITEVEQHKNG